MRQILMILILGIATLPFSSAFAQSTPSVLERIDPVELKRGEPAPADGLWLADTDALFLLAETERLLSIDQAVHRALENYDENFTDIAKMGETCIGYLEGAYTSLKNCQEERVDAYTGGDVILGVGGGSAVGVVVGVVLTLLLTR